MREQHTSYARRTERSPEEAAVDEVAAPGRVHEQGQQGGGADGAQLPTQHARDALEGSVLHAREQRGAAHVADQRHAGGEARRERKVDPRQADAGDRHRRAALVSERQQSHPQSAGERNAGGHVETNRVEGVHGHSVVNEKSGFLDGGFGRL